MNHLTPLEQKVLVLLGNVAALLDSEALDRFPAFQRGLRERCDIVCRELGWKDLQEMVSKVSDAVRKEIARP